MRIVAIPRDENDVIAEERARLSAFARPNGWSYLEYTGAFDLLAQIATLHDIVSRDIAAIEIVAHGNPAVCDDVSIENAGIIAQTLSRLAGVSEQTHVFLSRCNTGLEFNGDCVARSFAMSFNGTTFGSLGYITGTHAEENERCLCSFELDGIVYHPYPDSRDGTGRNVWRPFGRSPRLPGGENMQIKVATSGFRTVTVSDTEGQDLIRAIEDVLRTPGADSARMRMAPDLTFVLRLSDGEHVFELLAGGTVLRDPVTRRVWQFDRGREVLRRLVAYRKLPAA